MLNIKEFYGELKNDVINKKEYLEGKKTLKNLTY